MALIKYSALIADASGTVGGNVFARNKSGNYVRKWAKPTNAPTVKQSNARAMFSQSNAAFRALTQTQRNAWEDLAQVSYFLNKLGESVVRAAISNFLMCKTNEGCANYMSPGTVPIVANAPPDLNAPAAPSPYQITFQVTGGNSLVISSSQLEVPIGVAFIVEATTELPATKTNATNDFRTIAVIDENSDFDEADLYAAYVAQFQVPTPGCRVSVRIKALAKYNAVASQSTLSTTIVI